MTAPTRVAVVSDLHANALAVEAAFRAVDAASADRLVILGDLLTYGCEPAAVLDMVGARLARDSAVLIEGNHDAAYREMLHGDESYLDGSPDWVRDTFRWTAERVDLGAFATLPWQDETVVGDVLFTHANPFGARNWRYLNGDETTVEAARALPERNLAWGCSATPTGAPSRAAPATRRRAA